MSHAKSKSYKLPPKVKVTLADQLIESTSIMVNICTFTFLYA